jgi:hypothetical protein
MAGEGISIDNNTINNALPDQVVTITGEGATSVTGTYPNFTVESNADDADADSTNEIITFGEIINSELIIAEGEDTARIDVSSLQEGWNLNGNYATNPTVNYIGTADQSDLSVRTDGTERMGIDGITGNVGLGAAPNALFRLQVENTNHGIQSLSSSGTGIMATGLTGGIVGIVTGTNPNLTGLRGIANNDNQFGILGTANGTGSVGVRSQTTGTGSYGVFAQANGDNSIGVFGIANGAGVTGTNFGIHGQAGGPVGSTNYAVYGTAPVVANSYAGFFSGTVRTTDEYTYSGPRTRYKIVPASAFQSLNSAMGLMFSNNGGFFRCQGSPGIAPVDLPDGAIIQNIIIYYIDNDPNNIIFSLYRQNNPIGGFPGVAAINNYTTAGAIAGTRMINNPIPPETVDNMNNSYFVLAYTQNTANHAVIKVLIQYTVTQAD